MFFANSALLGVGLAMDAFSVSIVNALAEPEMRRRRQCAIAGVYAFFQFAMPMIGWFCVRTIASLFSFLQVAVPWIALLLLLFIGIKMIYESLHQKACDDMAGAKACTAAVLAVQGVATSIDALSVGFTIAEYGPIMATVSSLIIASVTFAICLTGLLIGRSVGRTLSSRAQILGGCILIFIGIEIWIRGVFF